jgi:hypothetical protein
MLVSIWVFEATRGRPDDGTLGLHCAATKLERLARSRHPQAELLLLRNCLGSCKIALAARCVPPAAAASVFISFDVLQNGHFRPVSNLAALELALCNI